LGKTSVAVAGAIALLVGFMLLQLIAVYPLGAGAGGLIPLFGLLIIVWYLAWLFYVLVWGMTSR